MQGMTNKQMHKVMRNDKIDVQVVIKLSDISDEKYTYLQESKRDETLGVQDHYNDECTTSSSCG